MFPHVPDYTNFLKGIIIMNDYSNEKITDSQEASNDEFICLPEESKVVDYLEHRADFLKRESVVLNSLYHDYIHTRKRVKTLEPAVFFSFARTVQILVLAVNEIEVFSILNVMLEAAEQTHILSTYIDRRTLYFGRCGHYSVLCIVTAMGSDTLDGTYESIEWSKRRLHFNKIKLIVSLGVCYGINWHRQQFGDVVVPDTVITFDKNIKYKDTKGNSIIEQRQVRAFQTASDILDLVESVHELNRSNNTSDLPFTDVPIHIRTLITGEVLIDSYEFKKRILDSLRNFATTLFRFEDIVGGDMEAFGLYRSVVKETKTESRKALIYSNCACVTIKGICDYGEFKNESNGKSGTDENYKDKLQLYAARNACNVFEAILHRGSDLESIGIHSSIKPIRESSLSRKIHALIAKRRFDK